MQDARNIKVLSANARSALKALHEADGHPLKAGAIGEHMTGAEGYESKRSTANAALRQLIAMGYCERTGNKKAGYLYYLSKPYKDIMEEQRRLIMRGMTPPA